MPTTTNDVTITAGRVPTEAEARAALDTLEQLEEAAAAVPVPGCPSWCTRPAGHPYESDDGLTLAVLRRGHEHGWPSVYTFAEERRAGDGTVTLGRATVGVNDTFLEEISAEAALALADDVRAAGELAQRINAGRTVVEHGITVGIVRLAEGHPFQARCLCGWASPEVPSRAHVVGLGEAHMQESR